VPCPLPSKTALRSPEPRVPFIGSSATAQAMLGVIIYDTAFNKMDALTLIRQFQMMDAVKLFLLVGTFIAVVKTKKILPSFFASLFIYVAAFAYLSA
jgi:hypothetical protein